MKTRWFLVPALLLAFSTQSAAGWIFYSNSAQEEQITRIQDNRLKFAAPDHVMIYNVADNQIAFLNPDAKTYWEGAPETFAASARLTPEGIEDMIEENLAAAPPQQREAMADDLRRQMLSQTGGPPPTVAVIPSETYETIAGYRARKHEIHINGELRQEMWIADGIDVSPELDVDRYGEMLRTFHSALGHNIETAFSDPRVVALYKKGWPLRTVTYDEEGYPEKTEVIKVAQKALAASEFAIPSDYRQLSSREIFGP